jgi:hypothetical protein
MFEELGQLTLMRALERRIRIRNKLVLKKIVATIKTIQRLFFKGLTIGAAAKVHKPLF